MNPPKQCTCQETQINGQRTAPIVGKYVRHDCDYAKRRGRLADEVFNAAAEKFPRVAANSSQFAARNASFNTFITVEMEKRSQPLVAEKAKNWGSK